MPAFIFPEFTHLKEKSMALIAAEYERHKLSKKKMTEEREAQVELIGAVLNHLPDLEEIAEEEKSIILTGAHRYNKYRTKTHEYGGLYALLPSYYSDPNNSFLYKNTDPAIGITEENKLDDVSENQALMAFRNYIMRYNIFAAFKEKARLQAEKQKEEALAKEKALTQEPVPPVEVNVTASEIEKVLVAEGTSAKALMYFTPASIAAEIGKILHGKDLDAKVNAAPAKNKKPAPFLKDEIQNFDRKKLKRSTTSMVNHTLRQIDFNDPLRFMKDQEDPAYNLERIPTYNLLTNETFTEIVEPSWDKHLTKTFPPVQPKPKAWELGRDDPEAIGGVDWKKVKEGDSVREKRAAWGQLNGAEGPWVKVQEAQKKIEGKKERSVWIPQEDNCIPKKDSIQKGPFTPEQIGFTKSYALFNSQTKKELLEQRNLKHADTQVSHEVVVDDEVVVPRKLGR